MRVLQSFCTFALLALATASAYAGDNIQVTATSVDGWPAPVFKLNGNETTQGTIQLHYVHEGYSFPVGAFARFSIAMDDVHLNGADNASYPATLTLAQNGSSDLVLTPDQASFTVNGLGPVGYTEVLVEIPAGVSDEDGTDLVGNLNFDIPGQNKVGTPTSVQVHIRLAHPDGCLHVFNFLTDTDFESAVERMEVSVNKKNDWVSSTRPSQLSDNVLVANACSWDESFDLQIGLDSRFETSPNGNPGNAVHTYGSSGIVDEETFDIAAFDGGTGQGQNLCIQNVTVPANTSFLAAVHSRVIHHLDPSLLYTDAEPLEKLPFDFSASLTEAGTACQGSLNVSMYPNPLSIEIPFDVD